MGAKPHQVLIDQRLEAAPPARVQPPPVPVPDAAPAPELQEEDPPPARSQDGQHGKHDCCTLQVHCRYISTQYIRQSYINCSYIPGISLHITRGSLLYTNGTFQVHLYTLQAAVICILHVHCRYISTQYKRQFCTLQVHCRNISKQSCRKLGA